MVSSSSLGSHIHAGFFRLAGPALSRVYDDGYERFRQPATGCQAHRKGEKMTVYVAEILGRGIAAFDAANDAEATQVRLTDKAFRRDLTVLQNEGRPLWDGVSQIYVREPPPRRPQSGRLA